MNKPHTPPNVTPNAAPNVTPADYQPHRRLKPSHVTEAAPLRYLKPRTLSVPPPACALPKDDPRYNPVLEFLSTLPRARASSGGEPLETAALREHARSSWAPSDLLLKDFGWSLPLLHTFITRALSESGIHVRTIFYTHHREPRTYFAIADEHWDLATIMLQEYWDSVRSR